jgi:hypothetical protein
LICELWGNGEVVWEGRWVLMGFPFPFSFFLV